MEDKANRQVTIRSYTPADENRLFLMLQEEGEEWKDYWQGAGREKYKNALDECITYLLFAGTELCGYARCRDDAGYGVYIYDLLVARHHRGNQYGRQLMEQVCRDYPQSVVYVMSDVDEYYQKLGYQREGSILVVSCPPSCL